MAIIIYYKGEWLESCENDSETDITWVPINTKLLPCIDKPKYRNLFKDFKLKNPNWHLLSEKKPKHGQLVIVSRKCKRESKTKYEIVTFYDFDYYKDGREHFVGWCSQQGTLLNNFNSCEDIWTEFPHD